MHEQAAARPQAEAAPPEMLPRALRRWDAVAIVVGSIIGSGIFVKEGTIAKDLGCFAPILSVWLLVGVVTWCGALAVAELAAMFPFAGGPYVYLREAYGPLPAFLWGWAEFWIVRTGSLGSLACATVMYLPELVPLTHMQQGLVAGAIVLVLAAINVRGVRCAASVQNVTTIAKTGLLALLIVLPWLLRRVHAENLAPLNPPAFDWSFLKLVGLSMIAVMWPYDGWINLGTVAEEVREPQRNVPFALSVGLALIIVLYLLVVLSYHLVLPFDQVAGNQRIAASVSRELLGPAGGILAAVGVMISTLGACNANMLAGPRIYFAVARDGLLPRAVSRVHPRFRTPANSIWLQAGWTLVLLAAFFFLTDPERFPDRGGAGQAFDHLTDFVIFGGSVFYAMAVGAVFVLRRRAPLAERPYRTWGYPVTPAIYLLAFATVLVRLLAEKTTESLAGIGLIAAGGVYYAWASRRR